MLSNLQVAYIYIYHYNSTAVCFDFLVSEFRDKNVEISRKNTKSLKCG